MHYGLGPPALSDVAPEFHCLSAWDDSAPSSSDLLLNLIHAASLALSWEVKHLPGKTAFLITLEQLSIYVALLVDIKINVNCVVTQL